MSQETPTLQAARDSMKERFHFIGEYGHSSHPAMGVAKEDMGIFIKERPASSSLLDVQNLDVRKVLFNRVDPTPQDLEAYLKDHEPFVAYLKRGSFLKEFESKLRDDFQHGSKSLKEVALLLKQQIAKSG